ncbi:MAG: Smr/MutS family protein [Spirochaetes bacterium]|nr:Smr/MutS family protein [Spirochaetota bacterium]
MSDFGKIYEEWEKLMSARGSARPGKPSGTVQAGKPGEPGKSGKPEAKAKSPKPDTAGLFAAWIDRHGVDDKDGRESKSPERLTKRQIEALPVDARLDLHGLTAREAEEALERFFRDAAAHGLVKVLVVHGKGRHSESEAVLPGLVKLFLERSPLAGRSGYADKSSGGRGAVWVLVRPVIFPGR